MSNRLAKLPPDPDDIASLRAFRARNEAIAELAMDLILIATPGARAEAATAARQAEAAAAAAQPQPATKPAAKSPARPLENLAAPEPPQIQDAATRIAGIARGPASPIGIIVACARLVRLCAGVDIRLSQAIAAAHTTAEHAGLAHPLRQPVLAHLQTAAREAETEEEDLPNRLDIAVTEELGRDPTQNPADLIQAIAQRFNLPDDPETYPCDWRPTRPPKPKYVREDWVPKDPTHPFNLLVDELMRREAEEKARGDP